MPEEERDSAPQAEEDAREMHEIRLIEMARLRTMNDDTQKDSGDLVARLIRINGRLAKNNAALLEDIARLKKVLEQFEGG